MFHQELSVWPLLCGLCIGAYGAALLIVYLQRKKKERVDREVSPFELPSQTAIFVAMFYPGWVIVHSGSYFSAVVGALIGVSAWIALLLFRGKNA